MACAPPRNCVTTSGCPWGAAARPTPVEADAVRTAGSAPLLFDNPTASRGGITRQRPAVAQRPPGTLPPPQLKPTPLRRPLFRRTSETAGQHHIVWLL